VSWWRDPRVFAPALAGLALLAPRALPPAAAGPPARASGVALPALHGLPVAAGEERYELDAIDSVARFLVAGPRGELLTQCPAVRGTLRLASGGTVGELELRFELASLAPVAAAPGIDVHHVLGVLRGSDAVYRGTLVEVSSSDLPGVRALTFLGTLVLGDRVVRQAMRLWWCALPGRAARLQGHGPVPSDAIGLPERRSLGLWPERPTVALGVDLAWRRRRGR
jgi:hypothetical protein